MRSSPGGGFPTTRVSALVGARSRNADERSRSFDALVAAYWKPVYKYIRLKWSRSPEDAQDLTQGFFLRAMEKDFFAPYDAAKGRFRTFLRVCLDGYLANEHKAAGRIKRGGEAVLLPLEFEAADGEIRERGIPEPAAMDRCFDDEWVRSLFSLAVDALRAECAARGKEPHFRIFEAHDLDADPRPSYADLSARFGLPVTTVTNHLSWARREFRRLVLETLRSVTGSEDEFRREARFLLGTDPP
ncbi:MAG: sigma-70 family RNA polymerase sigma factor [Acidobacteria bacterium]|nr:sigma-70 family RNA polymerase sigma factor [Acidobacteriota bacterium]